MKRIFLIALILTQLSCTSKRGENVESLETKVTENEVYEFGFPMSEFESEEGQIKRGEFFTNLMTSLGVPQSDIYSLTQASRGIFDLRKIKIGNSYKAFFTKDEDRKLAYLVYEDTKTSFVTFGVHDSIVVKVSERAIESRLKMAAVTINSSLWNDVVKAGYNPLLALRLSDIYAWSIDFFGLRKGDSFMAIYEELYVGDKFVDIGTIHGAYFTHAGREYDAYRFIQDEVAQYWNEKGENLRKAFLKAPLSFSRISSGFSYARRHPVTRVVRPHTGVDYAAPRGTPVMSIGDGVVIQKSYAGGGGNTVRIKHNSTYTTAYLHLHNYAKGLAVGKRVRQGEVIGYVGSTGLSTGPHLDFRVWKNGKAINPLTMEAPPADPIKKSSAESFKETISRVMMQRDSLISVGYIDSLILKLGKR
ncbi:MAG: peptidoglycan DD-metalloendopeptidase family protein [Bacteroidales bacterium]|nr:peptidoglycan DD-metalloendopeptidase family protein [Bacteroidales bacterium]